VFSAPGHKTLDQLAVMNKPQIADQLNSFFEERLRNDVKSIIVEYLQHPAIKTASKTN